MIEQWFKQDIEALLARGKRAVVCDANGSGAFLMNALQPDIIIMMVHNELEELEARYLTEKDHWDEKVVFYTSMSRSAINFSDRVSLLSDNGAKTVAVPMDNLTELASIPASVLGKTDVPFYAAGQMLLQKLILN